MERITSTQVDGAARRVNALLKREKRNGTRWYVCAQGRNGGTGLDLCYQESNGHAHVSRMLTFGTKREVWDYLQAMATALDLVTP